jgi:hypothetical protein
MDDFVTNASSKSKKRLISAHFWRVAADFTGREKYKTPSRAHGCLRRAGKSETGLYRFRAPSVRLAGRALRGQPKPSLFDGRLGYTFGMAYMSFFGQLKNAPAADPSGMATAVVITFKGVGLVLSMTCLALTWRSSARATRL